MTRGLWAGGRAWHLPGGCVLVCSCCPRPALHLASLGKSSRGLPPLQPRVCQRAGSVGGQGDQVGPCDVAVSRADGTALTQGPPRWPYHGSRSPGGLAIPPSLQHSSRVFLLPPTVSPDQCSLVTYYMRGGGVVCQTPVCTAYPLHGASLPPSVCLVPGLLPRDARLWVIEPQSHV